VNGIGVAQAAGRAQRVATIHTREEADQRQAGVRSTILKLIGGLPERTRPVFVKQFGTLAGDGLRIEKIAYESLFVFYVTVCLPLYLKPLEPVTLKRRWSKVCLRRICATFVQPLPKRTWLHMWPVAGSTIPSNPRSRFQVAMLSCESWTRMIFWNT
jgi:hypothetical protein